MIKFRYETRQSATNFIDALITSIRNDILTSYTDKTYIKDLIVDNPKYLPNYSSDPTITSMLNVLAVIEDKYRKDRIEELWTKLNERDNIQFYFLSLEKFGLTDDLYIKMNSRGKNLTEFEIFKSDLEKKVNKISPELKDILSKKIDNNWMDVLWAYAQSFEGEKNFVQIADDGYMCLFNNIFRLEMFRRGIEKQKKRTPSIDEIITDAEAVNEVILYFDMMADIHKIQGINHTWNDYFYFSDETIGKKDVIRLFWQQEKNRKPVFYLAMDRDLSVPETVYFYSIYLLYKYKKDKNAISKCLRVIRNLVTANVRANSARYDMLGGFMNDVEDIIMHDGVISDKNHTFVSTACEEERFKALNFSPEEYKSLLRYENHNLLQGSLMLFINKYEEHDRLFTQLEHFTNIFNNQSPDYFQRIRINLIDEEIEYGQYDPYMEKDENMTRRFFIHHPNDLLSFFVKNERRRNQEAILNIISNKFNSLNDLKESDEKCKEFSIKSWQYYMTKYESANREDTSYGCYAWDDKENRPMEMVILNSSYHSIYNIEWKMLNHILVSELWDNNVKYSLDPHASSPFVMNKCGVTFSITQNGWKMTCNNDTIINNINNSQIYTIIKTEEENTFIVDFANNSNEMDYIDLAKTVITKIENAYECINKNDAVE